MTWTRKRRDTGNPLFEAFTIVAGVLGISIAVGAYINLLQEEDPPTEPKTISGNTITINCALETEDKSVKKICADHGLSLQP